MPMKLFGRNDDPPRPVACTSEEYERLMKTLGRIDAAVESLETKWMLWKKEGDRLLARLDRRDQRAAHKEKASEVIDSPSTENDIERRIRARRGNAVLG